MQGKINNEKNLTSIELHKKYKKGKYIKNIYPSS